MADINIFKDNTIVSGTNNGESFQNTSKNVTINAGAGDDTINSWGDNAVINGESGNDVINLMKSGENQSKNAIANGGMGDDSISNWGDNVVINGEDGNDVIKIWDGNEITVNAGVGNNSINLWGGSNVTVNGGTGIDNIISNIDNVLINSDSGDDVINVQKGKNITVNSGTGNNKISILDDVDSVIINAENGKDIINVQKGSNITIDGGTGDDTFNIFGSVTDISVNGDAGNDLITIFDGATDITINTGNGEDTVSLWNASTTFIQSGAGNNTVRFMTNTNIHVSALDNSSITLDMAQGKQSKATLEGDTAGNYTLGGTSNSDVFDIKQGNVVITNYDSADTIKLSDEIVRTENIGNDVKLITDSSSILVKNGGAHYLKVQEGSNAVSNKVYGNSYKSGYSPQDVIKAFMNAFITTTKTGTAALDEVIQTATGDSTMTASKLVTQLINDAKKSSNFLEECCGIILGNSDTGAITGWDTGMSSEPIIEDALIPNNGPYSTIAAGSSETIDGYGLIVNYPSVGANGSTITETEQQLINGLHSWWIKESLKLFFETYGDIFTVNGKSLDIVFKNEANGAPASAGARSATQMVYNYNMYGKEGNLNIYDIHDGIALPHELTHAIMGTTNLGKLGTLPHFIVEGIAIVAGGMEGSAWEPTIKDLANDPDRLRTALDITSTTLISDNYPAGYIFFRYLSKRYSQLEPVIIDTDDTNVIRIDSDNKSYTGTSNADSIYSSDYLRYKNITITGGSNNDSIGSDFGIVRIYDSKVDGGTGNDLMYLNAVKSSVNAGSGDDTLRIDMSFSTIDGGAGNDWIVGNGFAGSERFNCINGGAGNDTIGANEFKFRLNGTVNGGDGNDLIYAGYGYETVNGGAGDDTINYYISDISDAILYNKGDGNDVIEGYNSIPIIISGGEVDGFTASGDDLILKIGTGSITLKDVKTTDLQDLKIIRNIQTASITLEPFIYDGKDTIAVTEDRSQWYGNYSTPRPTITGSVENAFIYETEGTNIAFKLGSHDDTLVASYAKQVEYQYSDGDGNDVISGLFDTIGVSSDRGNYISLGSNTTISKITGSGNDVILTIGTGSIILKDSKNKLIHIASNYDEDQMYFQYKNFDSFIFDGKATVPIIYNVAGFNELDTVIGTNSADQVYNTAGSKYIYEDQWVGDPLIIDTGEGNDTINNSGNLVSVSGGAGADYIVNNGSADTINAGKGNDTIDCVHTYYYGDNNNLIIQYAEGDDNDIILNYGNSSNPPLKTEIIKITKGSISNITAKGNDVVIQVGTGSITLKDTINQYSTKQLITIQDSNDKLHYYYQNGSSIKEIDKFNDESNIEVTGSDNNDFIYNIGGGSLSNNTIKAGAGNDTILGNGSYSLIDAGEGNNVISRYGSIIAGDGNNIIESDLGFVTVGNGDNTISNAHSVLAGSGNDSISGGYLIRAGKGNDTIINTSQQIIQYAEGDGNDVVSVSGFLNGKIELLDGASVTSYKVNGTTHTVKIGTGSITLKNAGSFVNIVSDNTDTMYMDGHAFNNKMNINQQTVTTEYGGEDVKSITINGTASDDYINNSENAPSTINSNYGDDYIKNAADYSKIYSGDGNDTIIDSSAHITISGGDGDDFIQVGGSGSETLFGYKNPYNVEDKIIDFTDNAPAANSVSGGAGNDIIEVNAYYTRYSYSYLTYGSEAFIGQRVTITGGTGDDTIRNSLNDLYNYQDDYMTISSVAIYDRLIQYADGDGNDVIEDYNIGDTIQITGEYSTLNSGNDVIITVGEGSIKLLNAKDKELNIVTVEGSIDDSQIVKLTNKDKSPYTADSNKIVIDASERTKVIEIIGNDLDNILIGGKKADTLTGGKGNDTFVSSLGKDVVTDYAEGDVISLTGALTKAAAKKEDITLTVGKGSMVLKNGVGKKLTMIDTAGNITKQTFGVKSINVVDDDGAKINTSIDSVVVTIDASTRTQDVELTGNSKANTIISGQGNDLITSGKGKDVLIYTGGHDTITDYTAGQDTISIAAGMSIESAVVDDNGTDLTFSFNNNGTLTIKNAIKNGKTAQKITINEGGVTSSQTYAQKYLIVTNNDNSTVDAGSKLNDGVVRTVDASSRSAKNPVVLLGSKTNHNQLIGGKGNDTINPVGGDKNTLTGGKGNDIFFYSGGYDIITDYSTAKSNSDSICLNDSTFSGYYLDGKDIILQNYQSTSPIDLIRIVNGKDKYITFVKDINGIMTVDTILSGVYNDPSERIFVNADYDNKIKVYDANDTIINNYSVYKTIIDASKRTVKNPIYIIGNNLKDTTIKGGKGDDILNGGDTLNSSSYYYSNGTDDVLTGGKGKDLFIFNGGNDIITDYTPKQDTIQINRSDYSTYHVLDKEVILTFGNGSNKNDSLTIKNGVNKKISLNMNGTSTVATFKDYEITVPGAAVSVVSGSDSSLKNIVTFDASKRKKNAPVTITGSAEHQNIIKGGAGDDVLDDGSTSDSIGNTLTGGKGNDVFVYRGSYDVITDYTSGQDTISVAGSLNFQGYSFGSSAKDLTFTFINTTNNHVQNLNIIGAAEKKIDFVSDGTATIPTSGIYGSTKYNFDKNDKTTIFDAASIVSDKQYIVNVIDASKKKTPITIIDSNQGHMYAFSGNVIGSSKADSISLGNAWSIFGGAGNDTIESDHVPYTVNTINGGKGNDVLIAGKGSVILVGGAGKDTFVVNNISNSSVNYPNYKDNVVISDYTTSQDVIQLGSGVSIASVDYVEDSYTDLVFDLSGTEKTITVKDAVKFKKGTSTPKKITFVTADGNKTSQVYAQSSLSIANGDGQTIDLSASVNSGVMTANASGRSAKNPIYLIGNNNNNSLVGGKGADNILSGSGDNTITGGKGDDTIQLGNDNNIIKYTTGDGNDVIVNYKSGDKIQLGSAKTKISNAALVGDDYVLTVGKNKITLKDIGSNASINVVDYSGEEKIYTNTSKTAAFIEKSFNELSDDFEDTWFTSIDSSNPSIEIDNLVDEFKESNVINYYGENISSIYTINKSNNELLSFATKKKEK